MQNNEIILFETDDNKVVIPVQINEDTVWLNRNQMAQLFDRDIKTIGKHINNALREELDSTVVAKFATTASDGKTYQMDYYENDQKLLDDHTLVALTIMIAESRPDEKEMMVSVIMNCLAA